MKKRSITIEFKTDASDAAVNEVAFLMEAQLESLNDGTMDLGTQAKPDEIDEEYITTAVVVI